MVNPLTLARIPSLPPSSPRPRPQVGALCAMNSSLLMPTLFALILFWRDLGPVRRAGTAALLAAGLALLVMIVAQNVQSLLAQARGEPAQDGAGLLSDWGVAALWRHST